LCQLAFWRAGSQHPGLSFHRSDRRHKVFGERDICLALKQFFRVFFISLVLVCKPYYFVVLASCWHYLCITFWDSLVPVFDYSRAISLVHTTRGLYPYIKGFSMLKYRCSLMSFICFSVVIYLLLLLIYSCKFGEFYFHCALVCYHTYVLISHQNGIRALVRLGGRVRAGS